MLEEGHGLKIALTVAEAMAYAWETQKAIHRDIKPSNIMFRKDKVIKLMDLGLTKSVSENASMTSVGEAIGTPHYMSPEQIKNTEELDYRTDIYSLGATLYELVTGREPYTGKDAMEVLSKVLTDRCPHPQKLNPRLSLPTCNVIGKMMAKNCGQRQQSWQEVINDLKEAYSILKKNEVISYAPGEDQESFGHTFSEDFSTYKKPLIIIVILLGVIALILLVLVINAGFEYL